MSYQLTEKEKIEFRPIRRETNEPNHPNPDRLLDSIFLSEFTPPSLLINTDLHILQFRGAINMYLEPAHGRASLNILKMVRQDLVIDLRSLIQSALQQKKDTRKNDIEIKTSQGPIQLSIKVKYIDAAGGNVFLLVVFEEIQKSDTVQQPEWYEDKRVKELELELNTLREDMRTLLEEHEAATEEMQSANEEIVSSNEELQSINEELETSKEEIESSNEELMTINQELMLRNEQLAESHEYTEAVIERFGKQ